MIEFTTKTEKGLPPALRGGQLPREPLYSVDGVEYSIPREFLPLQMAKYAHLVDSLGSDSAALWALREAVGDNGYFALLNLPPEQVSKDDLANVIAVVTGRMTGLSVEVPKGPGEADSETASSAGSDDDGMEPPDSEVWPESAPAPTGS